MEGSAPHDREQEQLQHSALHTHGHFLRRIQRRFSFLPDAVGCGSTVLVAGIIYGWVYERMYYVGTVVEKLHRTALKLDA